MKLITKSAIACVMAMSITAANAESAKSEKRAHKAAELRQSVYKLLGRNMGPLGGMARGKIAFDAKTVEKNATRINQLALMMDDYTRTDTSAFKVETQALDKVWNDRAAFIKRIGNLTKASANLQSLAATGNESEIIKAIAGVGKTCGGCHDNFKQD